MTVQNQPVIIGLEKMLTNHFDWALSTGQLQYAQGMLAVCILTMVLGEPTTDKYRQLVHQHIMKDPNHGFK
jgi:hypothetical protein